MMMMVVMALRQSCRWLCWSITANVLTLGRSVTRGQDGLVTVLDVLCVCRMNGNGGSVGFGGCMGVVAAWHVLNCTDRCTTRNHGGMGSAVVVAWQRWLS